jgi:hypothetical protein
MTFSRREGLLTKGACALAMALMIMAGFGALASDSAMAAQDGDFTYTTGGSPTVATVTGYTGAGGAVIVPSSLGGFPTTAIGNVSFASKTSITSVVLPNTVTSIGSRAFEKCSAMASVNMGNSVTGIGGGAFDSCNALTSVTIPDSVTIIEHYAFFRCANLTSVTIGNGVATILDWAFNSCGKLTTVTFGSGLNEIGGGAFGDCGALASVVIPNSVKVVNGTAFYNCVGLTSVTVGTGVTTIGWGAFKLCANLTSISFLGMVAPTSVDATWNENISSAALGHAYAASNFPAPGGRWNGLLMGAAIPTTPGAPTSLQAEYSNAKIELEWRAPAADGGSPVTGYKVYRATTQGGSYAVVATTAALNYTDAVVSTGQTYWYKVSATNANGEGAQSAAVSASVPNPSPAPDYTLLIILVVIVLVVLVVVILMRQKKKGK